MYQLLVKYTVNLWVSLRSFLAPLQYLVMPNIAYIPSFIIVSCFAIWQLALFPRSTVNCDLCENSAPI